MSETYIENSVENGSIHISEEVIASLVKTAVADIDGVAGISYAAGSEIAELIGIKAFNKGVKLQVEEEDVSIDVIINVRYGYNIVEVAKNVQAAVVNIIQTSLESRNVRVNVHVSGISFEK